MNTLSFTKMQGAGNDFVVFDNRTHKLSLQRIIELTPPLCDRKYGIGADGLIALQATESHADYEMIYRNADGSDAGMCGNGGRCIALFAHKAGFEATHTFDVHGKTYTAEVINQRVTLEFPVKVRPEFIEGLHKNTIIRADTGTEHIAMRVNDNSLEKETALVSEGSRLRHHKKFADRGTNVNFFCGLDRNSARLQTFERGVENLTLACGTGALATAVSWHFLQGLTDHENLFHIQTKGGNLDISFYFDEETKTYSKLTLSGAAHFVFNGTIEI